VKEGLPVSGGSLLANRPEAAGGFVCKRFASGAGLIEVPHRFVQPSERRVEVGARLLKRRVAEHVLHVVHRPAELSPRTFCTFRREFSSPSRRFLGGGAPAMSSSG
jgi:hypothetical protein